jgi:hypothetical protein
VPEPFVTRISPRIRLVKGYIGPVPADRPGERAEAVLGEESITKISIW